MPATALTLDDLADGAADQPLLGADAQIVDPLLVVDLAGAGDAVLHRAGSAARRSDRVLVGVAERPGHPLGPDLDLTLVRAPDAGRHEVAVADLDPEIGALLAAADASPTATVVLAGLLRRSEGSDVRAALDAESLAYSTLLGGHEFRRWLDLRGPRPLPPDRPDPVLLRRDGAELRITLNRPERRNAFGRQVRDGLVEGLQLAELDPSVERVRLDGAGPAFCSGGDLDEFGTADDLALAHLVRTRGGAGGLLHRLAPRTEVRVHGSCVGAGIELPAFAGRVLAAPGTTFRLPEVAMGLIPGAGGTVSLPRRIGRWRTLHLAVSGRPLDLAGALSWGLVDETDGAGGD